MNNHWNIQTVQYDKTNAEGNVDTTGYGQISILLSKYVLKEKGKGLSSNDFTDNDAQKLNSIEVGAEVNKLETISINNGNKIYADSDKNINIPIPTKTSDLIHNSGFAKLISASEESDYSDSYVGKSKLSFQDEDSINLGKNSDVSEFGGIAIGKNTSTDENHDVNIGNLLLHNNETSMWEGKITEAEKALKNDNGTNLTELDNVIDNLNTEIQNRISADETLQNNIDTESQARINADTTLSSNLDIEIQNRISADNILQTNINSESQARSDADNIFTQKISNIEDLIPNQTSSSNQLADKSFVNSTVQTNTANFRGNWDNWTQVPTDSDLYPQDYSGSKIPTVNDYLVVQDASDYTLETLVGTWRFKYTGDWTTDGKEGWLPEYQVNEEPFTSEQLYAINSGITEAKVTQYDSHLENTNNPHNVTKLQLGLGNVMNTADSDIPVEGGTTKFTTGGAYVEFAKKVDINQGITNEGKILQVNNEGNLALVDFGSDMTLKKTEDAINGDQLQIGNGTPINITNSANSNLSNKSNKLYLNQSVGTLTIPLVDITTANANTAGYKDLLLPALGITINTRTNQLSATGGFVGDLSGNADTATNATHATNADTATNASTATVTASLGAGGNTSVPMTFNWYGQGGQPSWLWGGNDGRNMYVYNPSNFNVNHAASAGTAVRVEDGNNVVQYKATSLNGYTIQDTQEKALYVEGREGTSGDSGGIAITNDGVTAFGAGDTDGVFRVINEDDVSAGPVFKVMKNGEIYTTNTIHGSIDGTATNATNSSALEGKSLETVYKMSNAGGICFTARDNATKTVSIQGFTLYAGVRVSVLFSNRNTAPNPTLNVNSTGAIGIRVPRANTLVELPRKNAKWRGNSSAFYEMWQEYTILNLIYNGTYWIVEGNPVLESYYSTTNSYVVYADGRIEQWGKLTLGTYTYTYPVPFTQTPAISPQVYSDSGKNLTWGNAWMLVSVPTTTGFEISSNFNSSYCLGGNWKAIGY